MIVIKDEATGWRIVSVRKQGWLFYHPRISNTSEQLFISFEDFNTSELSSWTSLLGYVTENSITEKELFFSREFGTSLLNRLIRFYGTTRPCQYCNKPPAHKVICKTNPLKCIATKT